MKITVLLADDHLIIRDGLRNLLNSRDDFEIIGETDNGRQAVLMVKDMQPDIIIMDISMPELNGFDAARQIVAMKCKTKILVLSMHNNKQYLSEMLKAGASGYLIKNCAFQEIVEAVKTILNGHIYLSREMKDVIVDDYVQLLERPEEPDLNEKKLTAKESEILQLFVKGDSAKDIALTFGLSVKTVSTHRNNIMNKLDLYNIADLTKYAIREGLTMLES